MGQVPTLHWAGALGPAGGGRISGSGGETTCAARPALPQAWSGGRRRAGSETRPGAGPPAALAPWRARAGARRGGGAARRRPRGGRKEAGGGRGERGKPAGPQDDRRGLMTSHNGRPPRVVEPVCSARVAPQAGACEERKGRGTSSPRRPDASGAVAPSPPSR